MPADNCLPALADEAEWLAPESPNTIRVAYDGESNTVTFHANESGRLVHAWFAERPDARGVADLFRALATRSWATPEVIQATAGVVLAILDRGRMPGQVTLQDELVAILRTQGNRWMTTAELAAEVNRRGRHWKTYRNRITAAKVLGRTKLYARTFERVGERVRLVEE